MHVRRESFLKRTEKIATMVRLLIRCFKHYEGGEGEDFLSLIVHVKNSSYNSVEKKRSALLISKK